MITISAKKAREIVQQIPGSRVPLNLQQRLAVNNAALDTPFQNLYLAENVYINVCQKVTAYNLLRK